MAGKGQPPSIHSLKGGEDVRLVSKMGAESGRCRVGVGVVADGGIEDVEADFQDPAVFHARLPRVILPRARAKAKQQQAACRYHPQSRRRARCRR